MKFKIMGKEGDAAYTYEGDVAEVKFEELRGAGMLPVVVEDGGRRTLQKFEPGVDEVIWMPAVMGG